MNSLAGRTWFELWACAKAQKLPFNTRWTRDEACVRLRDRLNAGGELQRHLSRLSRRERHALRRLQAGDGSLPRHVFTRDYGVIRRISRRDRDNLYAPWRYPRSEAERLWLFGFIEIERGRPDRIILTEEAARLLPPLPRPKRAAPLVAAGDTQRTRASLCRDLAVWLGALLAVDARPLHRRWIAPSVLRQISAYLPQPEMLDGVRSELASGRLRFLHYVAEAAGWIAVQGGLLKPTADAWYWLTLPHADQWRALWTAVQAGRLGKQLLWRRCRLPELPDAAWSALLGWLERLPAGTYDFDSLVEAVLPYCPPAPDWIDAGEDLIRREITALLDTVLAWAGVARRAGDRLEIIEDTEPNRRCAKIEETADALVVTLPAYPPPHALAKALAWGAVESWRLVIDAAAVRRAVEQGTSGLAAAETLAALCGRLPEPVYQRIMNWEREAKALHLRQMMVLTSSDPAVLDAICADPGLRSLIDAPLSAHHLAVRSDQTEALCRRLARRGHLAAHLVSKPNAPDAGSHQDDGLPLGPAAAEYAYLAIRVFQGLADFVPMPLTIPASAREAVSVCAQADVGRSGGTTSSDALNEMASRVLNALARAVQGEVAAPPVESEAPAAIRAALRQAYESGQRVVVDYFSPARGAVTTRQIEPLRWYERGGATYIEAWCGLENDARTFRLDRVLRVAEINAAFASQDGGGSNSRMR